MTPASLVLFNLLVNGVGSFAIGAAIALVATRWLRVPPGRAAMALLMLPFAKVVFDLARGVPEGSFLWRRAQGVPQDLGSFRVGFGVNLLVPKIDLALGAFARGTSYSQSAADLVATLLTKRVGPWAPGVVAALLLGVGLARLAKRAMAVRRTILERRRIRRLEPRAVRSAGGRDVPVYVVPALEGSPFTGGLLQPFIAFPTRIWEALTEGERAAAIEHELSHVADFHVAWVFVVGLVRDAFWFVPGIGVLERRFVRSCELAADARAVARGTAPLVLASALVRAREAMVPSPERGGLALGVADGSLATRIAHLAGGSEALPRWPLRWSVGRILVVLWIAATVFAAALFGNH